MTVNDGSTTTTSSIRTFNTAPGADPVLVGAGDIADCTSSGDEATGALVAGIAGGVYTLGDNVYTNGTAAEFANCYDPSWGPLKSRTRPVPGNHDWNTGNLNGYFGYYGAQAGGTATSPYYSYNVGSFWHVVVLDSDCTMVTGGCTAGSPQVQWLISDLAANSSRNVIAMWHHPRISSGASNYTEYQPFVDALYAAHADLVLVGHDHIYERFTLLGPTLAADPTNGIRYITAGTGGASHHTVGTIKPTSQAHDVATWGVLRLVLHPTSYDFEFLPIAGYSFTDSGSTSIAGNNTRAERDRAAHARKRGHEHRAHGDRDQDRSGRRPGQPDLGVARQRHAAADVHERERPDRHVRPLAARQRRRGRQHQRHRHAVGRHATPGRRRARPSSSARPTLRPCSRPT